MIGSAAAGAAISYSPDIGERRTWAVAITPLLLAIWAAGMLMTALSVVDVEGNLVEAASSTESGTLSNQLLVIGFAAIGLLHFPRALRALRLWPCVAATGLLLLYVAWAQVTIFWSADPALSLRRLVSFTLILVGAFGLGAGYYGRRDDGVLVLASHVVGYAVISFVLVVVLRLWGVSWDELTDPQWSLKADLKVSHFAYHAGYASVAALAFALERRRGQVWVTVVCLGFLGLVLKARTMTISTVALSLLVFAALGRPAWLRRASALASIGLLVILMDLTTGGTGLRSLFEAQGGLFGDLLPYVTLNLGEDNIFELSGRRPLWEAVTQALAQRWVLGHGFGGFWTPVRLEEIHRQAGWPAVNAHNGFLDEMLATGVIGLLLFLAFWVVATWSSLTLATRRRRYDGPLVATWLFAYLCFNAMDSVMQLSFQLPLLISLTGVTTLWGTAVASAVPMPAVAHPGDDGRRYLSSRLAGGGSVARPMSVDVVRGRRGRAAALAGDAE